MSVTYSPNLGLALPANGTETGTWGDLTNTNFGTLVEQAITGVLSINMTSGSVILTTTNGVVNEARNAVIVATGTQTVTNSITIPNKAKTYLVNNTSSFQVDIQVSGGSAYTCPTGTISTVYCDGLGVAAGSSVSTSVAPAVQFVPSGAVFYYAASTAPTGYLYCNGAAVSRSVYASLFAVVGTTYGIGDGSTTFNLPELRGEFIRGYNNQPSTGLDPGRVFASTQTDIIKNHTHPASTTASDSGHQHNYSVLSGGGGTSFSGGPQGLTTAQTDVGYANISASTTISNNTGGSTTETRPVNISLLPCIKT
jgi:microcystin-dependent protein